MSEHCEKIVGVFVLVGIVVIAGDYLAWRQHLRQDARHLRQDEITEQMRQLTSRETP